MPKEGLYLSGTYFFPLHTNGSPRCFTQPTILSRQESPLPASKASGAFLYFLRGLQGAGMQVQNSSSHFYEILRQVL